MGTKAIACLGDPSDHGGEINYSPMTQVFAGGNPIAVEGATHSCPIPLHGTTPIVPITVRTFAGGKLVITALAKAGCGATIIAPVRGVLVE